MSKELVQMRALARLLDDSIPLPGTNYKIGIDALIGLIPGFGDAAGALLSSYIVLKAAHLGVSISTLIRMTMNILVEGVVGAVPFFGDVFDAVWKANMRNMSLVERELTSGRALASSKITVALVGLILVLVLAFIFGLLVLVIRGAFEVLSTI